MDEAPIEGPPAHEAPPRRARWHERRRGTHAPGAHGRRGSRGSFSVPAIAAGCAVIVFLAAGGVLLARHDASSGAGASPNTRPTASHSRQTDQDGSSSHSSSGTGAARHRALAVASIEPRNGQSGVKWRADVLVHYSEPLASRTELPTLQPSVPGTWTRIGPRTVRFQPTGNYVPWSKERVIVPSGSRSAYGTALRSPVTSRFTVAGASELRLQELLAELGYLPLRFAPASSSSSGSSAARSSTPRQATPVAPAPATTGTTLLTAPPSHGPGGAIGHEASAPSQIRLSALPGRFVWRYSSIPPSLSSLWTAGAANEITVGAVMAFENAHGLGDDGVAGPVVWKALLAATAARQVSTAPYDYVMVSEGSPEYVTVWQDGANIFTTLANTGISQAPTQRGTWPVYVRYVTTTMSGTEPNGQHYSDPGIPWVSYFHGGDALHGYLRSSYGFPQSLGCVEMPYSSAKTVYPLTPIGTLVTVS